MAYAKYEKMGGYCQMLDYINPKQNVSIDFKG